MKVTNGELKEIIETTGSLGELKDEILQTSLVAQLSKEEIKTAISYYTFDTQNVYDELKIKQNGFNSCFPID